MFLKHTILTRVGSMILGTLKQWFQGCLFLRGPVAALPRGPVARADNALSLSLTILTGKLRVWVSLGILPGAQQNHLGAL